MRNPTKNLGVWATKGHTSPRKGVKLTEAQKKAIGKFHIGNSYRKGAVLSRESKEKISKANTGRYLREKSPVWKGEAVGYRGLHIWVSVVLGKPEICTHCLKKGIGHQMHWANISGKYKREVKDWVRLCAKCHRMFDLEKINI